MKLFKTLALTTVVLLAAAGSANAKKCQLFKTSGSGATLQEAVALVAAQINSESNSFIQENPDFKFDGVGKTRFSCRTKNAKFKIDRNATSAEFQSELTAIMAVNEPGTCTGSVKVCSK